MAVDGDGGGGGVPPVHLSSIIRSPAAAAPNFSTKEGRRPTPEDSFLQDSSHEDHQCGKSNVDFIITTPTGNLKLQTNSIDGINLLSLVAEMADYQLGCGTIVKENNASIIFKGDSMKMGEIISIEFVPKGFKL